MDFNIADYIGLEARPAPRSIMKKNFRVDRGVFFFFLILIMLYLTHYPKYHHFNVCLIEKLLTSFFTCFSFYLRVSA